MPTFSGDGVVVTKDMLPKAFSEVIPLGIKEEEFKLRLREGGRWELSDGAVHIIGTGPNFGANSYSFYALDELVLNNGTIVTNGNTLVIFVNKLSSNNGKIVSFLPPHRKANRGVDGQSPGERARSGEPGDFGGFVSIHIIDNMEGTLEVDLSGQDGGDGGNGVQGIKGQRGQRGEDGVQGWGPFGIPFCQRGGQDGGPGGIGGAGGNGGDGGVGGHGGILQLINVGANPVSAANYRFTASGAPSGIGGQPASGGPGGDGGEGGSGTLSCGGGHGGPIGPQGPSGVPGNQGAAGAPGRAIIKALPLELIITRAGSILSDATL